jgi:phage tail sheath protein FI
LTTDEPPANTVNPWANNTTVNVTSFTGGWNGENVAPADFVGTLNPSDDTATGLKIFEDPENLTIDVLCAPGITDAGGTSFIAVHQEIARICDRIHAVGYLDVPDNLNLREATDWHNGEGLYTGRGKLDTFRLSCFWNWIQVTDPFTGESVWTAPTVGALQRTAVVYDTLKPWYAIAGEKQGVISSAGAVRYERVSLEAKNGSYGNGNSINSILRQYGQIMIYGDRTMQRAESKLTELHSVHLVNHIVRNFGAIGRRFTFDPNDPVLVSQLDLEFRQFLKGVVNERGVEQYLLEVGATAAERNRREVHVNLQVIPTSVMEKMFLNVTVRESGAVLTAVGNL